MDISTLEVADTAPLHLKDAAGNLLYEKKEDEKGNKIDDTTKPVRIIVYGPSSDAYAQLETKQTQRTLKRLDDNDGKRTALGADDRLQQTAEDLADVTYDMENLASGSLKGRDLFLAIYGNRKLGFITNQVTAKLGDWGNFKGASPSN